MKEAIEQLIMAEDEDLLYEEAYNLSKAWRRYDVDGVAGELLVVMLDVVRICREMMDPDYDEDEL